MTERENFEKWWNDSDNACRAVNMTWTEEACWFAWQARGRSSPDSCLEDSGKCGIGGYCGECPMQSDPMLQRAVNATEHTVYLDADTKTATPE